MSRAARVMPMTAITSPMSYGSISRRVFAGEMLVFAGGDALLRAARALCRRAFAADDPRKAHALYGKDEFFARADEAQRAFNGGEYKALFADRLKHIGISCAGIYWDTLGLRIAPPMATHGGGWRSSIGVHRDTWGAGIQAQINWWAPIWPLADGRTMQIYPHYWQKPLANTTGEWSFKEYLAARKKAAAGHAASYPSAPAASAAPQTPASLIRMRCGELIAFASAHLHASVPNRTALTRFSLEIRTVDINDIKQGRGAPNADCQSAPLYRLFRAVDGGAPLSPD